MEIGFSLLASIARTFNLSPARVGIPDSTPDEYVSSPLDILERLLPEMSVRSSQPAQWRLRGTPEDDGGCSIQNVVDCLRAILELVPPADTSEAVSRARRLNRLLSDGLFRLFGYDGRILFLGAHCDDIEIGCAGTVLRLVRNTNSAVHYALAVDCGRQRAEEAKNAAMTMGIEGARIHLLDAWGDGTVPRSEQIECLGKKLGELRNAHSFTAVFCHRLGDSHRDHDVVAQAAIRAFRGSEKVLMYHIEKPQRDLSPFDPTLFVNVESVIDDKMRILEGFSTQGGKLYVDAEYQRALLRMFGGSANCRYAEAFILRRATV